MNNINGSTKVLGVIGNPIEHTISPLIHNILKSKINHNVIYVPFKVEPNHLDEAIKGAYSLGIYGLNITVPYKQKLWNVLKGVDEIAEKIGAVNTLKYKQDGYHGYNTDLHGLEMTLKKNNINIENSTVAIQGAGGAAYSAGIMAAKNNASKIILFNRTKKNANNLAQHINKYYNVIVEVDDIEYYNSNAPIKLFIQTTPVGMETVKVEDNKYIGNTYILKHTEVAFDIIYNPYETPLLKKAKEMGTKVINGFDMLVYQGLKSYEIWFDIKLDNEVKEAVRNEVIRLYYDKKQ